MTSTYPPERHVVRDLRMATLKETAERCLVFAPVQQHVRADDGALRLGVIGTLIDSAGAVVALPAAAPDWIATADLSYQAIAPAREGPVICAGQLVRAGASIVVVGVEVYDGHGSEAIEQAEAVGVGLMTFSRIPARATVLDIDRTANIGRRVSNALPDSGYDRPLHDKLGLRVVDAATGIVELDKGDYVRNSFGTINGGAICMLFAAAAEHAARAAGARPYVATDLQVHYLAQTRSGPARTRARVVRLDHRHAVCNLHVVDAGHDDVLLAVASVTLLAG